MQQINLYTDAFRPRKIILPLEHIIGLTIIVILCVTATSLWLKSNLEKGEQKLLTKTNQAELLTNELNKLEQKAKLLRQDDSLAAANQRLSARLLARRQMIDVLDSAVVEDDEGFSNLLTSLARQKTAGLWLTRIHVGTSGQEMTLEGTTLNANAVPAYLQNLRQEPGFIGRTFTLFNLDLDPGKPESLDFRLLSQLSQLNDSQTSSENTPMALGAFLDRGVNQEKMP